MGDSSAVVYHTGRRLSFDFRRRCPKLDSPLEKPPWNVPVILTQRRIWVAASFHTRSFAALRMTVSSERFPPA